MKQMFYPIAMTTFSERLKDAFNNSSMAEIGRRLSLPHATVRNYFGGRLPVAEVLIKIADETNVSLNWLLTGIGEKFTEAEKQTKQESLDEIFEERMREIAREEVAKQMQKERGRPSLPINLNNSDEDRKAA